MSKNAIYFLTIFAILLFGQNMDRVIADKQNKESFSGFSLETTGGICFPSQATMQFKLTQLPPFIWQGGGRIQYHFPDHHVAISLFGGFGYTRNVGCYNTIFPQPQMKFIFTNFSIGAFYTSAIEEHFSFGVGCNINVVQSSLYSSDTSANPNAIDTTIANGYINPAISAYFRWYAISSIFFTMRTDFSFYHITQWGSKDIFMGYTIPYISLGIGYCFGKKGGSHD